MISEAQEAAASAGIEAQESSSMICWAQEALSAYVEAQESSSVIREAHEAVPADV